MARLRTLTGVQGGDGAVRRDGPAGGDVRAARERAVAGAVSGDPIAEAIRRWREAETRLYPVIMARPDLYERSILAVRKTVESLQRIDTTEALVAIEAEVPALVRDALAQHDASAVELDLNLIAGAALKMRHAEIEAASARSRRTAVIAQAQARGDAWVVVGETGERRGPGALWPPYHRLEMRVADGLGLHLYVEADPSTARPVYGLETVRLDPATGEWAGEGTPPLEASFTSPEPWEAEALALRQGGHPGVSTSAPEMP